MMILVVLVQTTLFAQSTQTIEKPLKLTSVAVGTISDDVLLSGATDQVVKKISVNDLLISKANLASPTFTGTPTLPTGTIAVTQTAGNSTNAVATTAFVTSILKPTLQQTVLQGNTSTMPIVVQGASIKCEDGGVKIGTSTGTSLAMRQNVFGSYSGTNVTGSNQSVFGYYSGNNNAGIGQTVVGSYAGNNNTFNNTIHLSASGSPANASSDNQLVIQTNPIAGKTIRFNTDVSYDLMLNFPSYSGTLVTTDSPTFTGTPILPIGTIATTQTALNNTTAVATTAFVTTANNLKANLASPTFTGTPTLPTGTIATTQTALNNTTAVATTAFVTTADNLKANLASPTFTGTPTLPTGTIATTQIAGNNTTAIATTAFVTNANSNFVNLTNNQSILGTKTFNKTGALDNIVSNNTGAGNGIVANNSTSGNGIFTSNTSNGYGLYASNSSVGIGIYSVNASTGNGIHAQNNSTGIGIYSVNASSGKSIVSNKFPSGAGFNFVGQNASIDTFTVDSYGVITGTAHNLSALNTPPASATATGTLGEIRFTPTGIFICTAANTWIKCVGATF